MEPANSQERGIIEGMEGSLAGRLLVALPTLLDPNFFRTVVLVLDHDGEGALGVILNRPSEVEVAAALDRWSELVSSPSLIFVGGPVQPEAAICLARPRTASIPDGYTPLAGGVGSLDLEADPALVQPAIEGLRVFSGYAGWGPSQLEAEVETGDWLVVDPLPSDVFDDAPGGLWQRVLRRQPGDVRILADFPASPSLN